MSAQGAGRQTADTASLAAEFEQTLKENIVNFWYPRCLDPAGGYLISFDQKGHPVKPLRKMIVTQARMVWFFSAMARAGYRHANWGPEEMLAAARHGYRFLMQHMRDPEHDGFYWEVDPATFKPLRPEKVAYGHAFVLYALAELALASARKDVAEEAVHLFDLLEEKMHDASFGGYRESFRADWRPLEGTGPMGPTHLKLMNSHLHLTEAVTTLYEATRLPRVRERLLELMVICSNTMVRKNTGACTDRYERDWTPRLEGNYNRVSYGHDLENVWLLMLACERVEVPRAIYMDLFRTLWDYSLKYGFDREEGGFFESGPLGQPADNRNKVWWVQAETLVSALRMYRATGEQSYWEVFRKIWEYLKKRQIDWVWGEWHDTVLPDGSVRGNKGHVWKAAYHNGRAMLECARLLK